MGQVENLNFVNNGVLNEGATFVFNIKIEGGSALSNNFYTRLRNYISGTHTLALGGSDFTIIWNSRNGNNSSAYYFSTCLHPEPIVLAHTRQLILNFIREERGRLTDPAELDAFNSARIVYSVTRPAGIILNINIAEVPANNQ